MKAGQLNLALQSLLTRAKSNVAKLAYGTFLAQLIMIVSSPILTRLYGAQEYGLAALFMNTATLLMPLCSLSLQFYIPLIPDDNRVPGYILKFTCLTFSLSVLVTAMLALSAQLWPDLLGYMTLQMLILIPIYVSLAISFESLKLFSFRKRNFGSVATSEVVQAVVGNLTKITFAGFGLASAFILNLMSTLACMVASFTLLRPLINEKKLPPFDSEPLFARPDFPFHRTPRVFVDTLARTLPVFFLSSQFKVESAAFWGIAVLVVGAPMLLANAYANERQVRYSILYNNGNFEELRQEYIKLIKMLAVIAFAVYPLIWALPTFVFQIAFGQEWGEVASFVSRLAPWYLAAFIAKPAVNLAAIYKFQGSILVLDSIYLVLILSAFYFTVSLELTELWCVLLLGLVGTLVKVAAIGVSMFYLDKKLAR